MLRNGGQITVASSPTAGDSPPPHNITKNVTYPPDKDIRDLKRETVGRYCWGFDSVLGNTHPTPHTPLRLAVEEKRSGGSHGNHPSQDHVVTWESVADSVLQCSSSKTSVAAVSFTHHVILSYAQEPWRVFVGDEVFRWWQGFVGCQLEDFHPNIGSGKTVVDREGAEKVGRKGCSPHEVRIYLKKHRTGTLTAEPEMTTTSELTAGGGRTKDDRPSWLLIDPQMSLELGELRKAKSMGKFESVPFIPDRGPGSHPPDRGWDNEAYDAVRKYFWGVENGLVFEAGALDGRQFSVSSDFLALGWHRLVVEGTPAHWKKALELWGPAPPVSKASRTVNISRENTTSPLNARRESKTTYIGACICDVPSRNTFSPEGSNM